LEATDAGWAPEREQLLASYPHLAEDLKRFFAAGKVIEEVTRSVHDAPPAQERAAVDSTLSHMPRRPVPAAMPNVPGYEVLSELSRGGMGIVYRATQIRAGRLVALKMIRAGSHAAGAERERFLREARSVARMQHANVVQIFEVDEHEGLPFF